MSQPSSIAEYLGEFNLCLQVRLNRRRRILAEVEDHLRETAAHLQAKGASPAEAEIAAIAAFGAPDTVARSFGTDLVASLEKRLSQAVHIVDTWMAAHPWAGAAVYVAPIAVVGALVTVIGALAGVRYPLYGLMFVSFLVGPYLWRALRARAVGGRPEPGLRARLAAGSGDLPRWLRSTTRPGLWAGSAGAAGVAVLAYEGMTKGEPGGLGSMLRFTASLLAGLLVLLVGSTAAALGRRWRQGPGERRDAPSAKGHPWRDSAGGGLLLLSSLLAVVALDFATPLAFRVSLVVLMAALIATGVVWAGTEGAREERRAIQRELVGRNPFGDDIRSLQQRLETCKAKGDRRGEATALVRLGDAYSERGQWDQAVACAEESLDAYRSLGDRQGEAKALISLGYFYEGKERGSPSASPRRPSPASRTAPPSTAP